MIDDQCGAFCRIQIIMCIQLPRGLILDEKLGIAGFANIMIQRANARQQTVGTNCFRSLLCEVSDLQTVLISPWSLVHQIG